METFQVLLNNFRRSKNHKGLLALTFLLPIMLCLTTGIIPFGKASLRIGILVPENTEAARETEAYYKTLDQMKIVRYEEAKTNTLHTDLMTGKYHMVLDFRKSGEKEPFEIIAYKNKEKVIAFWESVMNGGQVKNDEGLSQTERSVAFMQTLLIIFSTIHASTIIRDKHSGTLTRYRFVRQSYASYLMGCAIYTFIIAFVQMLLCVASLLILQKGFSITFMETLVTSFSAALTAVLTAVCICCNSKSEASANVASASFAAIMALLGGTFVAIEAMPPLLRILSILSPNRWIVELLRLV